MSAISTAYMLFWLGLPVVIALVLITIFWRLWKKRPIRRLLVIAGILIVGWLSLSPVLGWLWRRQTMATVFGQAFSAKIVYSRETPREFNGDGSSLYLFEIPKHRIPGLTNASVLRGMGLPKQDSEMKGWRTISWQNAPFLNDTNDIQFLAFASSDGADPAFGVSGPQLRDLMNQPSTMFACSYKMAGGLHLDSIPQHAYMVSFYIFIPTKQQLIVIFSKT